MIISRTPLRISFVGGGSDLASFYSANPRQFGAVISVTINKYIYITVNKKFDNLIRASYSITEFVKKPEDLKHELIRESLLLLKLDGGIEITSISDIPSKGTGLGSSSTYTVGLLHSLHAFKGKFVSAEKLAQQACEVEINRCQKPIGKQDQYAAAFGNLNYIQFNANGSVFVDPVICRPKTRQKLENNLLLLYTGATRASSSILARQNQETKNNPVKREILSQMVDLVQRLKAALENDRLEEFGQLLDQNWQLKKQMSRGISNAQIDRWYRIAKKHGALGGKILGAGGGGFLLLYAPQKKHSAIEAALPELKETPFKFELEGSKIIYFGEK